MLKTSAPGYLLLRMLLKLSSASVTARGVAVEDASLPISPTLYFSRRFQAKFE